MKVNFVKSTLLLLTLGLLVGCGPTSPSVTEPSLDSTTDNTSEVEPEFIDYVEDEAVRLKVDYKGRDFFVDGVAEMEVATYIDGDTVHFTHKDKNKTEGICKARFYGVDTPESTGTIEPYGRGASNFTKNILKEASKNGTIVVSSLKEDYGLPEKDGTTSRYLGLIWYNTKVKNCDYKDLRLLNLALVQNGWSMTRSLDRYPTFKPVFQKAERQARNFKLNMFSGKPDKDFNYGGYTDVSMLDLKREIEKNIIDPDYQNKYDNAKVCFRGTVSGYFSNTLYVQSFFTKEQGARYEEGEYATINIYGGAGGIQNRDFTTVGAYVEICGTGLLHGTFGFQITSANFPFVTNNARKTDCKVIIPAEENTSDPVHEFAYDANELNTIAYDESSNERFDALYSKVNLNQNVIVDSALKFDSGDIELSVKPVGAAADSRSLRLKVRITFVYYLDHENQMGRLTEAEDWKGLTFKVSGTYYPRRTRSGNLLWSIAPSTYRDIINIPEAA